MAVSALQIVRVIFSAAVYVYFLYVITAWLLFQINFRDQTWSWASDLRPLFPFAIDSNLGDLEPLNLVNALRNTIAFGAWCVHHSTFARQFVKKHLPQSIERSLFVLVASMTLHMTLSLWSSHHVGGLQRQLLSSPYAWIALLVAWLTMVANSFSIDHFELFGLRQAVFGAQPSQNAEFKIVGAYKVVRHPMMTGLLLVLWMSPLILLTFDRLLFSALSTAYIVIGVRFEEQDLQQAFGAQYTKYSQQVSHKFFNLGCPFNLASVSQKQE